MNLFLSCSACSVGHNTAGSGDKPGLLSRLRCGFGRLIVAHPQNITKEKTL